MTLVLLIFFSAVLCSEGKQEKILDVKWFGQTKEERWGSRNLGTSKTLTIHTHGCALTATAMVLDYYGYRTNPSRLNKWLVEHNGFDDGWDDDSGEYLGKVRILWDSVVSGMEEISSYSRIDFRDRPADTDLIRSYLDRDIPVIAEVLRPKGIPHFVVIYGYNDEDFLIRDPLDKQTRFLNEMYNISDEYGGGPERNIFGIRIYQSDKS